MKNSLLFDFVVNKENNQIHVTREFNGDLQLVWDAWTLPEILDLWWAPKPWKTVTHSMDFRDGGSWFYSMNGPSGERHYCRNNYEKIYPLKSFSGIDAFCNEDGTTNTDMPQAHWDNQFSENNGTTTVQITAKYNSLKELETVITMGFKEGFTMALGNLDQYLESQFMLRQQNKTNNRSRVSIYLNFPGNTEEAMNFYQSIFKSDFVNGIQRFGDIPPQEGQPPIADNLKKMVLHVELPILGGVVLMATDAPAEMGMTVTPGNNMHINLEPDSREEASRLFNALSEGGNITMPLQDMFWGAFYGSLTDRYGINWMINHQPA